MKTLNWHHRMTNMSEKGNKRKRIVTLSLTRKLIASGTTLLQDPSLWSRKQTSEASKVLENTLSTRNQIALIRDEKRRKMRTLPSTTNLIASCAILLQDLDLSPKKQTLEEWKCIETGNKLSPWNSIASCTTLYNRILVSRLQSKNQKN